MKAVSWCITIGAFVIAVARVAWPALPIDSTTVLLLVVALVPWIYPLIKELQLPGGVRVRFRDVDDAQSKIRDAGMVRRPGTPVPRPSYLTVMDSDPALALVGLRIELESRLRALAEKYDIGARRALASVVNELRRRGVLAHDSAEGLLELIRCGNQAAHGIPVEPQAASWALDQGPHVLAALDSLLGQESEDH